MVEPSVIPSPHWSHTVLADEPSTFAAIDARDTLRRRIVVSLLSAILGAAGFGIAHAKPEYDAVAALAGEKGLPFHTVWNAALAAIEQEKG